MPSFRRKPVDLVIDVRSHIEFWLGHLDGATCVPVDKGADVVPRRPDVKPDTRILLYCASGARSAVAAGILKSLGYRNVVDGGGIGEARANYTP